mgnify:CR=1 FL=1
MKFSIEHHKSFLVQRVLEYGLLADWYLLVERLGIPEIAQEAAKLRELDPKALSFISSLSGLPINQFRCFTTNVSNRPHWNF